MEGRQVNISSDENLHLISHEVYIFTSSTCILLMLVFYLNMQGAILITGEEGIILGGLPSHGPSASRYQLCVCAVSRRLFLVPSNTERCAAAQDIDDICTTE